MHQTAVDNFGRNRRMKNEWPHLFMTSQTLYLSNLTETPFNAFANRVDPDQASLVRAA